MNTGVFCIHFSMEVLFITKERENPINEQIRVKEMMVIGPNGEQLGIKSKQDALTLAKYAGFDLVLMSENANPAVCKIMDYGKYRFEMMKREKEAKKKQHVTEVKPLRLSPVIDTHDFETKLRQARGWAEDGMKIKVDMRFRGRMITRQDVGKQVMNQFIEQMSDVAGIDKQPTMEGNTLSVVLTPKKK